MYFKPTCRSVAVLLCLLSWAAQPSSGQEDFVPMFNGRDLTGWVLTNTPPDTWSFKNGILVCSGKPYGEIRTEEMYQNFVMELEWRHMVPRGNAGIFVWADDITARGVPFHRGIEVQVLENEYGDTPSHTTHGDIFPIHGATMTPVNGRGGSRAFPSELRSRPSPEWNHYRIEGRDGQITLAVNGKVVTQGKDCIPRKGYICLESEGGIVHYRNVRIRELPASNIAPEHIAITNRGYRSIYSGLDLRGWQTTEAQLWKPKDWILAFEGKAGQSGMLESEESFQELSFIVDVRFKDAESKLDIQAGPDYVIDLQTATVAELLEPVGGWNRIEATNKGNQLRLKINGLDLPEAVQSVGHQAKLILNPTGAVDFCNIYVR